MAPRLFSNKLHEFLACQFRTHNNNKKSLSSLLSEVTSLTLEKAHFQVNPIYPDARIKFKALNMLGNGSVTEAHPRPQDTFVLLCSYFVVQVSHEDIDRAQTCPTAARLLSAFHTGSLIASRE